MCTAITYQTKDFYFGRTLDHELSYAEEVTLTPRKFPLIFRHEETISHHYGMIGMAHVVEDYPLYYDGMNEKGLAMAGLNFVGYGAYEKPKEGRKNVAQFELVPWVLSQCTSVREARQLLQETVVTDTPFSECLPPAQLHWMVADSKEAITLEPAAEGLRIYDNPVGVLANNPTFPEQLFRLNDYMQISPNPPVNLFSEKLELRPYSRGMGALGLPGDLSSQSRFVRALFGKLNSVAGASEQESVTQFFHILGMVEQVRGCCRLENGRYEYTVYSSCCNTDKGIYYYTTYENRRITAVNMHREKLDDAFLIRYPLIQTQMIRQENG